MKGKKLLSAVFVLCMMLTLLSTTALAADGAQVPTGTFTVTSSNGQTVKVELHKDGELGVTAFQHPNRSDGMGGYAATYWIYGDATSTTAIATGSSDSGHYDFTGLAPGKDYYVTVAYKEHDSQTYPESARVKVRTKPFGGYLTINGDARYNAELSVDTSELRYDDSYTLSYQWYRYTHGTGDVTVETLAKIEGATGSTYKVTAGDIGHEIYVIVYSSDDPGEGYLCTQGTSPVAKAWQPFGPNDYMTCTATDTTITVNLTKQPSADTVSQILYSKDGGRNWQTDNQFTDLKPGKEYSICVKFEGNDRYFESMSNVKIVRTKTPVTITYKKLDATYDGTAKPGYTGTPTAAGYDGEFVYQYRDLTTGDALDGPPTDAGCYQLTIRIADGSSFYGEVSFGFDILKKHVIPKPVSGLTKVYDGTDALPDGATFCLEGVIPEDEVFIDKLVGRFHSADVGKVGISIYASTSSIVNTTLGGKDAGNYSIQGDTHYDAAYGGEILPRPVRPGTSGNGSGAIIQSPKTFDAGIALYAGLALSAALGAAYVGKKR